jgi:hypothetical protein
MLSPKQSIKFCISARESVHLFLSLFVVFTIFFSINGNAQTCTANTNVTADCTDLELNGAGVVTVDAGVIVSGVAGSSVINAGASNSLINAGELRGNNGFAFENNANLGNLSNSGTIRTFGAGGNIAIQNNRTITNLFNSGLIASTQNGLENNGTITSLINASGGVIGSGGNGLANNGGTIETLTNIGIIGSAFFFNDINNNGVITTLNNLNAGLVLTYGGTLPTNYNIIINSPARFGQLNATGGAGNTSFGISSLSSGKSAVSTTPYAAVLIGVTRGQLGIGGASLSGQSNGYSYVLTETDALNNIWSLLVFDFYIAPSVANTNQSLVNTASILQGTFALQSAVLANSLGYDCSVFGANNICISTGGRYTAVSAANGLNNTSALLIGAYRLNQNYRIGAYVDQNLSVNNAGTTVRLGNSTPLIGLFGAWNERLDGTGTEVKVSAAYGKKNTTVNRQVVGDSEAGTGSSQLSSQGAQVTAKHGFAVTDKAIVSPYVGMRYIQNNMGGYTEGTSTTVTAPLTYSALNTRATTALAGVGVNYKVNSAVTTFASAGVEADTKTANGSYLGTNSSISGLTAVNFNANPVKVRASAVLGAYYDVEKNQRFGITGIYREEAYRSVNTTAVFATYTVGL